MGSENRILQLESPLGEGRCTVTALTGCERLNGLSEFDLTLVVPEDPVTPDELIGEKVHVTVTYADLSRKFHGVVCEFNELDPTGDDTYEYSIRIVPELWLLGLSSHNRIFSEMNTLDIVQQVVSEGCGMSVERAASRSYKTRETCCQFGETDLEFVQRLLAEEGIAYCCKHTDSKCLLVLSDSMDGFPDCSPVSYPYNERDESLWLHRVSGFKRVGRLCTAKLVSTDYGEYDPDSPHQATANSTAVPKSTRFGEMAVHGRHDFERSGPGRKLKQPTSNDQVERWLQGMEAGGDEFDARSGAPSLIAGHKFELEDTPVTAGETQFLLTEVRHSAAEGHDESSFYSNSFTCVATSSRTAFLPRIIPEKPRVWGPQTAKVTEVKNPESAGANGEVKLSFPWQEDDISCWARVAQLYAGNEWGGFFIPDVGQEVLVEYINGDTDRPVVVGAVYNDRNRIPPYSKWQSGIKTRSKDYNELRFDDSPGAEEVYFQAGMDHNFLVKNDEAGEIKNDQKVKIGNDQTLKIGNDQTLKIGNNQTVKIGTDQKVDAGQSIKVKAGTTIDIEAGAKLTLKVGSSKIEMTPAGITIESTMVDVKGTMVNVKGNAMTEVSGSAMLTLRGGLTRIN